MKIYNDSRIPTGLGKPSYMDVFEDGYRDGYDAGYRYGKDECEEHDCDDAYNLGLEVGYASGSTAGYASGVTAGYGSGYTVGYESGFTDGVATCQDCDDAYDEGYADGYEAGQNDCEGCEGAYDNGFRDGYESGYTDGADTCEECSGAYDSGYTDGYQSGYTRGYNTGYADGEATCSGYTPTPPEPVTGTCYVTAVYKPRRNNVTGNIMPTKLLKEKSYISKIVFEDGTEIAPTTSYTFSDTDEKYVYFVLNNSHIVTQQFANTDMIKLFVPVCPSYNGDNCFIGNSSLISISVEEGITELNSGMFASNASLRSVVLPSTLSDLSLCVELLGNCPSLSSITITATVAPTINNLIFRNMASTTGTLYYPAGSDYSTWLAALPSGWVGQEI